MVRTVLPSRTRVSLLCSMFRVFRWRLENGSKLGASVLLSLPAISAYLEAVADREPGRNGVDEVAEGSRVKPGCEDWLEKGLGP